MNPTTQANTVIALEPAQMIMLNLADCLKRLLEKGETTKINLTEMALRDSDLNELADYLGVGDLTFRLQEDENCLLRETAYAGVWWLTCYDESEQPKGEFIEVTRVPEELMTDIDEIRRSAEAIKDYL